MPIIGANLINDEIKVWSVSPKDFCLLQVDQLCLTTCSANYGLYAPFIYSIHHRKFFLRLIVLKVVSREQTFWVDWILYFFVLLFG